MWNQHPWSFLTLLNVLEDGLARSNFSDLRKPNCKNEEQTDTFENKTKQNNILK